jgi:tetratricopeptide (TPR) repeat protein
MGAFLHLTLLLVTCFTLSTWLSPRFEEASGTGERGLLGASLGESRKILAEQFYTRSDIYFHSGYYPTIFDRTAKSENHAAGAAEQENEPEGDEHGEHKHGEHCDHSDESAGFLGKPKDPLDAFTRHFFTSSHTHLTEKGTNAAREILPWMKLASQLDPTKVDSYTVGAYWLRTLNRADEAEQFLREGLRRNPQSHEILLELGRLYFDQVDYAKSRNHLEMALKFWLEQEKSKPAEKQNVFAARQIVNFLAAIEEKAGNRAAELKWLEKARPISPDPAAVDKRIAELRSSNASSIQ